MSGVDAEKALEQRDYYAMALRAIDGLRDDQGDSMRAIARATLATAALVSAEPTEERAEG